MAQLWFDPSTYLAEVRREVPRYDELQQAVAAATAAMAPTRILELGTGTGETSRRVLALHEGAELVGVDVSDAMLDAARAVLPPDRCELRVQRLEDALPAGPFDLVISALAVHHLTSDHKADLFARVRAVLADDGRFVLADVVVPADPTDATTPLEDGVDLPDTVDDQLAWLGAAGFTPAVTWHHGDLAVIASEPAGIEVA